MTRTLGPPLSLRRLPWAGWIAALTCAVCLADEPQPAIMAMPQPPADESIAAPVSGPVVESWTEPPSADQYVDLQIEGEPTSPWRRWQWMAPSNGRNRGRGNPLEQESWLNRPFSFSMFNGGMFSDDLLHSRVQGGEGFLYGGRLGVDVGHFWGLDMRLASTTFGVRDGTSAPLGDADLLLWDVNWIYYPWGDAQWRPFAQVGMGVADYDFGDDRGSRINQTTFGVPFGGGIKYRHDSRWVFRMDVLDNMSFASGGQVDTTHNISLTAGVEARFGSGHRKSYWPWNPSRGWK